MRPFIHLEDLGSRSSAHSWTIRPHVHRGLHQVCCLTVGGGELITERKQIAFAAPCIIVVPAGVVHCIHNVPRSKGLLLTFANEYLDALVLREPAFDSMYAGPAWVATLEDGSCAAELRRVGLELASAAPGHAAAVDSHLTALQVEMLRLYRQIESGQHTAGGRRLQLVTRFRQLIEMRWRDTREIATYGRLLGVTAKRLRAACLATTGRLPSQLIADRLALEARRIMQYTDMSIGEIGQCLGFNELGHFSRYFTRIVGISPRRFRADLQAGFVET